MNKLLVLYPLPPDVTETSCGSCAFRSLVECQLFGDYGDPDMMMTRNDACREAVARLGGGGIDLTVGDVHSVIDERDAALVRAERAEKKLDAALQEVEDQRLEKEIAEKQRDEARAERDALRVWKCSHCHAMGRGPCEPACIGDSVGTFDAFRAGQAKATEPDNDGTGRASERRKCRMCLGDGWIVDETDRCPFCKGTGMWKGGKHG